MGNRPWLLDLRTGLLEITLDTPTIATMKSGNDCIFEQPVEGYLADCLTAKDDECVSFASSLGCYNFLKQLLLIDSSRTRVSNQYHSRLYGSVSIGRR